MFFKKCFLVLSLCSCLILFWGPTPFSVDILWQFRLPKLLSLLALTGSLGVAGLFMQILFANPLAGPYVLGTQQGASLAMALFYLCGWQQLSPVLTSFLGTVIVSLLLFLMRQKGLLVLLLFGILLGQFFSGVIGLLLIQGPVEGLRAFLHWGMGSFSDISLLESCLLFASSLCLLVFSLFIARKINIYQWGETYARNYNISVVQIRIAMMAVTCLSVAITVSFAGPLSYLGLMAPHISRYFIRSGGTFPLILGTFLVSGVMGAWAQILSDHLPFFIPINILFSFVGPVFILFFLLNKIKREGALS